MAWRGGIAENKNLAWRRRQQARAASALARRHSRRHGGIRQRRRNNGGAAKWRQRVIIARNGASAWRIARRQISA